ncbi:chaoptin-like [Paramacrobiotus metropolitanus]|uniref:chaoptin-like n=1 Tax=Paramacrobiotus metropolitanus TaxID=2943436 RepID=UPI002446529E|nr:chaoptin-like [Paramacrobiotus metropolitanus]
MIKNVSLPDSKGINLFIWSSTDIVELESGVFSPIQKQLKSLHLYNVSNLINFPVLRESQIRTLKIQLAPGVTQFNAELLPATIEKIVLMATGITQLQVDLQEVIPMQNMKLFAFAHHTITGLSNDFMDIFPNLETLTFTDNIVSMARIPDSLFTTKSLLKTFVAVNNTFTSTFVQQQLFETIIENLNVDNGSVVNLAGNNLQITKDAVTAFSSINTTRKVVFAGNQFDQFFSAGEMFRGFEFLQDLDLSNTGVPKQVGLFRKLTVLRKLDLSGNRFRDLARIDIFQNLTSPLETLDLSDNIMMAIPKSESFTNLTATLQELILRGNKFHSDLLDVPDENSYPAPVPLEFTFPKLTRLDLSKTGLKTFKGSWTANFPVLRTLDISCNKFKQVTREFFVDLTPSLEVLVMEFCAESMQAAPKVHELAFTTLGNGSRSKLSQLVLKSGYFKTWILKYLRQLPAVTKTSLKWLDLSKNQIKYLDGKSLTGFSYLEKLNLGENFIQTIGPKMFSDLSNLRWLNISGNHIVSIQVGEFAGLNNLQLLDLSNNGLLNFGLGSLDSLKELTHLYLAGNNLRGYIGMFVDGGKKLRHLSLARNPFISLYTYPTGCVDRKDLIPLENLQFLYIDKAVSLYIDHGNEDGRAKLIAKMRATKPEPRDPYNFDCQFGIPLNGPDGTAPDNHEPGGFSEWMDDFLRLTVFDPTDLTTRTFVAMIPKCIAYNDKQVRNSTTNFICPIKDPKTFDPTAKKPADDNNS